MNRRPAIIGLMNPAVHIIDQRRYDVEEIREKCRDRLEEDGLNLSGKTVFLKPSFVYPARPPRNLGVNTQPELVGGVARAVRDLGASLVMVGEDCIVGPSQSGFAAMGVLPYLRGVAWPVYLQDEERVEVKVEDALIEDRFRLPKSLVESDVFITLPKLKVNMFAKVTLSTKNHIGLLLQADRLTNHHYNIHKKIADLYRSRVPDYVIADAVVAGAGQGPMHAAEAPLNLIVAGKNGVAVDSVCATLMGHDPEEIDHLVYLSDAGLGPLSLADVDIRGEELIASRSRSFARPRVDFSDYPADVVFQVGTELACPEGCLGMVRSSLDRWLMNGSAGKLSGFTFIIGKPAEVDASKINRRKTIVVGDCAREHAGLGCFIPGCPIPPMDITYALMKKGVIGRVETGIIDLGYGAIMQKLGLRLK